MSRASDSALAPEPHVPEGESIGTGAIFNSVGQALNLLGAIVLGALVGRALGPEGKGVFTAMRQLAGMSTDFGGLGVIRSGHFFLGKRQHSLDVAVGTYFPLFFVGVTIAAIIIGGLGWFGWAPIERLLTGGDLDVRSGALLLLPMALTFSGFMLSRGILQGIAHFRSMTIAQTVLTTAQLLPLAVLWWLSELTVVRAVAILLVAQLLGAIVALFLLGREMRRPPRPSWSAARETARYGLPLWVVDIVGFVLVRIDLLIVGGVLGTAELGPYSVAYSLATLLWFAPEVVWMSAFRAVTGNENESGLELTRRVTHASVIVTTAGALAIALGAWPFVSILYGEEFMGAVPLVWWLLPGYAVQAGLGQYGMYLLGTLGRPVLDSVVTGLSAVLKIALTWVALAVLDSGVTGVAIACSVAFMFEGLARVVLVQQITGRSLRWLCVPTRETTAELGAALLRLVARVTRRRG